MAYAEDLNSEFDDEVDRDDGGRKTDGLLVKLKPQHVAKADKNFFQSESDRQGSIRDRPSLLALDAYSRHKRLINEYILCHPGAATALKQRDTSKDRTDLDVIRQNAKFLWDETAEPATWEQVSLTFGSNLLMMFNTVTIASFAEVSEKVLRQIVQGILCHRSQPFQREQNRYALENRARSSRRKGPIYMRRETL